MNHISLKIALRYLLSHKSHGAVNVISAISLAAVAVAAAAIIIVLSVFNGFNQLAISKLGKIDPNYRILPIEGMSIESVDSLCALFSAVEGVSLAAPEINSQAFGVAGSVQGPLQLKGLTPEALTASGLSATVLDGAPHFLSDTSAIASVGVAMNLYLRPIPGIDKLTIYEPRRVGSDNPANPMAAFHCADVQITGVYQVEQEEYDRDMVIIPYRLASRLMSFDNAASSIAVYGHHIDRHSLHAIADQNNLTVLNRFQQEEHIFRLIAIEKWITFLMLAFILVIASMNIISTLSMLILDKQPNMNILCAMGGTRRLINSIFATQGWLIVALGGASGIAIGALLVLGQQYFGWVKLGASDPGLLSVSAYPVELRLADMAVTMGAILLVGVLITMVIPFLVGCALTRQRDTAVRKNA